MTFHGVTIGIPVILNPLFKEFGIRPTYLISNEVMDDSACLNVLDALSDVELGTHLHGEYVPPANIDGGIEGTITSEMQWEYGYLLEKQKLVTLTEKFRSVFGRKPRSFRAGRFGAGPQTGRALLELEYDIDSSVTPHISWESRFGTTNPDFRSCPEFPYHIADDGNLFTQGTSRLLELPVTIVKLPEAPGQPQWFRPWISGPDALAAIVEHVVQSNQNASIPRPLVMMFHNMEVFPGASPYPQTIADVDSYIGSLQQTFKFASQFNILPLTMSEYFDYQGIPGK